jgi:hypothetical protein
MHIKGKDLWVCVDVFSMIILVTSYTKKAINIQLLVTGIVFHNFCDAFLNFVQLSKSVYTGTTENLTFYGILWLMVGVGCAFTGIPEVNVFDSFSFPFNLINT